MVEEARRAIGLKESAEHIEQAVEVVRAELGKMEMETDWPGLSRHFATGAEATKELARELAESQASAQGDALVSLFMLRQIEVSMSFIARLSNQMATLHQRLDRMEKEIGILRELWSAFREERKRGLDLIEPEAPAV